MIRPNEQQARTPPSELDLDGLNAAGVVALLTRQTVRRPRSVAATLDYFGLLGRPAAFTEVIAPRNGITSRTLANTLQAVRKAAGQSAFLMLSEPNSPPTPPRNTTTLPVSAPRWSLA